MGDNRKFNPPGTVLVLGHTGYTIDDVLGMGGSCIVYRAGYEDALNRTKRHNVLIKELYPWTSDGTVFRGEDGGICVKKEAQQFFERCKGAFIRGNGANLSLLEKMPEKISGNINSFEAYGTYYSVLPAHGGTGLDLLLENEAETLTLKRAAELILYILDGLECFHGEGLLHLDISPDNVLILPSGALLIDYNSVWIQGSVPEEFIFSEKPGYVSPEVRLRELSSVGPGSDLYSVSAIFFRMITGRRLMGGENSGTSWKKAVKPDLPIFKDVPETAVCKTLQILYKGLHVLSRKRYAGVSEMKNDISELILRIEKKGITESSLYEESVRESRHFKKNTPPDKYIRRNIISEDKKEFSEAETAKLLAEGARILLTGEGGMGKTSFLKSLCAEMPPSFKPGSPVFFYIPLAGYQNSNEEAYYIHKYILRRINLKEDEGCTDICVRELDRLFDGPEGSSRGWVFLLDGLNEAGTKTRLLLKEIQELGKRKNTGIIITDRSGSVKEYALEGFLSASLPALKSGDVKKALIENDLICPDKKEDLLALSNPLLLSLYTRTAKLAQESGRKGDGLFAEADEKNLTRDISMNEVIVCYTDELCRITQQADSGDKTALLRHKYILEILLPKIALSMKQKGRTVFTIEELSQCLEKDYDDIRSRAFARAFPEYLGKSRLLLENIADEREWFDIAVREELSAAFGLIKEEADFGFKFIHDNFIDALAVKGRENRARVNRYKRQRKLKSAVIAAALAAAAIAALVFFLPKGLTKEQEASAYSAASRLIVNTGIINSQINAQLDILDELDNADVLSGDEDAVSDALEMVELNLSRAQTMYSVYSAENDYVDILTAMDSAFSADILMEIYTSPEEMDVFLSANAEILKERFLSEDSVYDTADKKEPMIEAYEEYLAAYADVYYIEYCMIIMAFEEAGAQEAADELSEYITQAGAFYESIGSYSLGTLSAGELEEKLAAAKNALKQAKLSMAAAGLYYE